MGMDSKLAAPKMYLVENELVGVETWKDPVNIQSCFSN
jgi:hypothetical protein